MSTPIGAAIASDTTADGDAWLRYETLGWDTLADQPVLLAVALVALAAAVIATVWFTWRERSASSPARLATLTTLRIAAIAAAVGAVVGVERRSVREVREPSRVVILIDNSLSMASPNAAPGDAPSGTPSGASESRSEAAAALVTRSGLVERLAERHRVSLATFSDRLRTINPPEEDPSGAGEPSPFGPAGAETRLGGAIEQALAQHAGASLAGLVLLTDGGHTTGPDPMATARTAKERGVLIHAVGYGPLVVAPNLVLREVAAPKKSYPGDDMAITVSVAAEGLDPESGAGLLGAEPVVTLRRRAALPQGAAGATTEVGREAVRFAPGESIGSAHFTATADQPGDWVYEATVASSLRESSTDDNLRSANVAVVDRVTKTLLLAGGPTRDFHFVRDQLHRDKRFVADVLLQSAAGAVSQDANRVLEAFPSKLEEIDAYDAVVAFDPDWSRLTARQIETLQMWVSRRGGGLIIEPGAVGASRTRFGDQDAVVARLSPVNVAWSLASHTLPPDKPSPVRLTPAGQSSEFLRLSSGFTNDAAAGGAAGWNAFPGFYRVVPSAEPKPAATVYAYALDETEGRRVLFAEQFYGGGRVFYTATSELWRLRRQDTTWFTTFYTNLLRHVSQGRLLAQSGAGALALDRDRYEAGDEAELRLSINSSAAFDPATAAAIVTLADQPQRSVRLEAVEGEESVYRATLRVDRPGDLRAAVALGDAAELLEAEATVVAPRLESKRATQDADLLRSIARATGGAYYADNPTAIHGADDLAPLAEAIPSQAETRFVHGELDADFARRLSAWLLGVLCLCLILEWTLRRFWRLA
ncbi:hypothetical protein Mal64_03420 [Pseudobythopirellula maris]|uniref:VWFA domain-containing protein n=1 Tax=Pseudobythopirellula maris TaxID=2527991 RepID=A0A5C5ZRN7_9BACT|nr:vWA domain-containing protein [Pseudobythopirellula maris]TWT89960.1 hypothetical protein Mal64_03420 [Pseudobythopirellula maris]